MTKNIFVVLIAVSIIVSGCGIHNGLTSNVNNHQTDVVLSNKNFKVVARVEGTAGDRYIFGIGGLDKSGLISNARSKMLAKAQLIGKSRAIINETVEIKNRFVLIYTDYTVTVSAYIIEFYNNESELNMSDITTPRTAPVRHENIQAPENITNDKSDEGSYEIGEKIKFYDKISMYYVKGVITNIEADTYTIEYSNLFKTKSIKIDKGDIRKL